MTQLSYGSVKTYKENGYGFVRSLATTDEVFFHIKVIWHEGIRTKIENLRTVSEPVSFWYTFEHTGRGYSVIDIWPMLQDVPEYVLRHSLSGLVTNLAGQIRYRKSITPGYLRMLSEMFSDSRIGDEKLDEILSIPLTLESQDKIVPLLNGTRLVTFNRNLEILRETKRKAVVAEALKQRMAAVLTLKFQAEIWNYWAGPSSRLYHVYHRADRVKWLDCMFLRDPLSLLDDRSPEMEVLPPLPETWRRIGLASPVDTPQPLFGDLGPMYSEWLLVYEWDPGAVVGSVWDWFVSGQDHLEPTNRLEPELYVPTMYLIRMADYLGEYNNDLIMQWLPTLTETQKCIRPLVNVLSLEWFCGDSHAAFREQYSLKFGVARPYTELNDEERKKVHDFFMMNDATSQMISAKLAIQALNDFTRMFDNALLSPIAHAEHEAPTIISTLFEASRRLWQGETLKALPKLMTSETLKALAIFALWGASESGIAPTVPFLSVDQAYSWLYEHQEIRKVPEADTPKAIWTETIEETREVPQSADASYWCNSFTSTSPQSQNAGRTISTDVVGVTFDGRQRVVATLQSGQQIVMRREPTNAYDNNAIRVETMAGAQIGYISRYLAATLARDFDVVGGVVYGVVSAVTGGFSASSSYGVDIQFTMPSNNGPVYDDDF